MLAATGSTKIAGLVIASQRKPGDRTPNLVISTGGDTMASNAILAQQFKCKNVFVGSLRGVSSGLFSAVLHVNPALADQSQHWIGLKPAPIDPDRPFSADGLPSRYAALLLGGPTKAEPFEGESLPIALRAMAAFAQTTDCNKLLVFTSRRTPRSWVAAARKLEPTVILYTGEDTPFTFLRNALLGAEMVAVTADSSSMITEAIYARRRTIALTSAPFGRTDGDGAYLRMLESRNLLATINTRDLGSKLLEQSLATVVPLDQNPLDLLAKALVKLDVI
ncbi:MAG: ELM1/GtrOC1 family putative glycosyltransferase [Hyphomicrobiales bacterium]